MDENKNRLDRTKEFALRVIRLYAGLPNTDIAPTLGPQLLRSATSVGAHYRKAPRGKLELLVEAEIISTKNSPPSRRIPRADRRFHDHCEESQITLMPLLALRPSPFALSSDAPLA